MHMPPIRIPKNVRPVSVRAAAAALTTALMAALVAAAPAAARVAGPEQTAHVSPGLVESGKSFQVHLSGMTAYCDPHFSRHEVKVEDGVVKLNVMAANNRLADCSGDAAEYKTEFTVPALKAGEYRIEARLYPECYYDDPACNLVRDPVDYAGILHVKDSAQLYMAIRADRVEAGKPFELSVSGRNFTCGNEYANLTSSVQGRTLYIAFTNRSNPEAQCPAVAADYGPTFTIPALEPGVYQVMAAISPYCGTSGPCPLALIAPQLAGALTVGEIPTSLRPDAKAARGNGMRHGALRIDPVQGALIHWKGGTTTLTGKRQ